MAMPGMKSSNINTKDGINWYCERSGSGPNLVLIPSGEGDCGVFAHVATALADSFTVTSFDMPGMSRSTAPEAALKDLTAEKLAAQVINLMDAMEIEKATFWGCSSGGLVVLALGAQHPTRVRNLIVHEVPSAPLEPLKFLLSMDDASVVAACREGFATGFSENEEKWNSLGPEYFARLEKNWVPWARHYVAKLEKSFSKKELTRSPVTWTIGALTPAGHFYQNVIDGFGAGIQVGLLPSLHFPAVTVPEVFVNHLKTATKPHL